MEPAAAGGCARSATLCPMQVMKSPADTVTRPARVPEIDRQRCTGCGRCVGACDLHLLSLDRVRWEKFALLQEAHRCTGCSQCAAVCPFHAIAMKRPAAVAAPGGDASAAPPLS